jgi:hypothetical protein
MQARPLDVSISLTLDTIIAAYLRFDRVVSRIDLQTNVDLGIHSKVGSERESTRHDVDHNDDENHTDIISSKNNNNKDTSISVQNPLPIQCNLDITKTNYNDTAVDEDYINDCNNSVNTSSKGNTDDIDVIVGDTFVDRHCRINDFNKNCSYDIDVDTCIDDNIENDNNDSTNTNYNKQREENDHLKEANNVGDINLDIHEKMLCLSEYKEGACSDDDNLNDISDNDSKNTVEGVLAEVYFYTYMSIR